LSFNKAKRRGLKALHTLARSRQADKTQEDRRQSALSAFYEPVHPFDYRSEASFADSSLLASSAETIFGAPREKSIIYAGTIDAQAKIAASK